MTQLVQQITVESRYTPPMVIDQPFAPGKPNWILSLLKPKITIQLSNGLGDYVSDPWGDPAPNQWPVVQLVLLAAGAVGVVLLVRRFSGIPV